MAYLKTRMSQEGANRDVWIGWWKATNDRPERPSSLRWPGDAQSAFADDCRKAVLDPDRITPWVAFGLSCDKVWGTELLAKFAVLRVIEAVLSRWVYLHKEAYTDVVHAKHSTDQP